MTTTFGLIAALTAETAGKLLMAAKITGAAGTLLCAVQPLVDWMHNKKS